MIEKIIGLGFMGFGLLGSVLDRTLCGGLCSTCSSQQLSPCFFLFLFVGIIFIISGFSLVMMKKAEKNLPKFRLKK
ncbi:MAG: hypothetical protein Q8N63_00145 [Nanoarchaeota archaeon]|nr:hypothetical protein [Nanoarchaeota archaeon]